MDLFWSETHWFDNKTRNHISEYRHAKHKVINYSLCLRLTFWRRARTMKSDNSKHCHTRPVHTQCKHEASEIGGRRSAPRHAASFFYYSIQYSYSSLFKHTVSKLSYFFQKHWNPLVFHKKTFSSYKALLSAQCSLLRSDDTFWIWNIPFYPTFGIWRPKLGETEWNLTWNNCIILLTSIL